MSEISSPLPDFDNPPVNEVVFGIQFNKLSKLKAPHTGILWEKLGREIYPECQEMAPLSHMIERFDEPTLPSSPITIEGSPPLPRVFFINATQDHLLQIQQDRFHQNWRKLKSDDKYPRHKKLYPKFLESWKLFSLFINELDMGALEPNQYELTYVNHIPRGEGWVNVIDIEKIFPEFQCKTKDRFLPEPENVFWQKIFRLPNDTGRLYTSLRLAMSKESKDQIMIFDLTARGFIPNEMDEWFGIAHEWIVRGFADLTGQSVQDSVWKRK